MFKSGYILLYKITCAELYRVGYGILVTMTDMNPIYTMVL